VLVIYDMHVNVTDMYNGAKFYSHMLLLYYYCYHFTGRVRSSFTKFCRMLVGCTCIGCSGLQWPGHLGRSSDM
jgi:hypothetical protein